MTQPLKLRLSYTYTDGFTHDQYGATPMPGTIVYPVVMHYLAGSRGYRPTTYTERYEYRRTPGRTNMSNEERVTGWLGCTDMVDRFALGRFRVVGQSRTHLHLERIDDDDEG